MSDYGFAVQVSQKDLNQNLDDAMRSVKRVLYYNYKQHAKELLPELLDFVPFLLKGKCTTDDGYGEIPFAWFVCTERTHSTPPGEEDQWRVVGALHEPL